MSLELRFIITSILFMFLLNVSLGFVLDGNTEYVTEQSRQDIIDSLDLGFIGDLLMNFILGISQSWFSLFGVDYISVISILPLWLNSLLLIYNIMSVVMVIFYLIDRIWIG